MVDMWLVRDHGMVNLLGHGNESSASAWQQFEKLPQIEGGSLQSAIVGIGDQPYEMFPLSGKVSPVIDDKQLRWPVSR